MLTWYSAIWPSASLTRWSLIQAEVTPRRVLVARSRPWRIASSKLCGEVEEISVTRATAILLAPVIWGGPAPERAGCAINAVEPRRCLYPGRGHRQGPCQNRFTPLAFA